MYAERMEALVRRIDPNADKDFVGEFVDGQFDSDRTYEPVPGDSLAVAIDDTELYREYVKYVKLMIHNDYELAARKNYEAVLS